MGQDLGIIETMDLKRQYRQHRGELLAALEQVCEDAAFSGGKYVKAFEVSFARYQQAEYCSGVNSGTSALSLALRALGVGPGDEVIVPANTFIASAWGAVHNGATPVFVDCRKDTWEIDETGIEEKLSKRTKGIIGVHLYGQPFHIEPVLELARAYGLFLVEDCAQAHGALYQGRPVGTFGQAGCFSFYPGKNLGAYGEAGAVVTGDRALYERVESLKNHGSTLRYHHDEVGFNMRMDGFQGAVLSVKLRYLDQWTQVRRQIAAIYRQEIHNPHLVFQATPSWASPVYHLLEISVQDNRRFMAYMEERGIRCSQHYPVPCHLQKVFAYLGYRRGDLPNAEHLADTCVTLPLFPEMEEGEIARVVEACNGYHT